MPKTRPIKPKDLAKAITKLGFYKHHQVGSHVVYKHADGRRTTIPLHNRELKKGLLHGILKDIKLTREELEDVN